MCAVGINAAIQAALFQLFDLRFDGETQIWSALSGLSFLFPILRRMSVAVPDDSGAFALVFLFNLALFVGASIYGLRSRAIEHSALARQRRAAGKTGQQYWMYAFVLALVGGFLFLSFFGIFETVCHGRDWIIAYCSPVSAHQFWKNALLFYGLFLLVSVLRIMITERRAGSRWP